MSEIIEVNSSRIADGPSYEVMASLMGASKARITYIRYSGEPSDFSTYLSLLTGYIEPDSLIVVECNSMIQDPIVEAIGSLGLTICCTALAAKQELYRLVGYSVIFASNGTFVVSERVLEEISTTTTSSVPMIILNHCGESGSILLCPDDLSPDLCYAAASNYSKVYGCSEDGARVREAYAILGSVKSP